MWVNPLLQALIDAAQSEQTSRTIRIVCTILVSLLYLIGLACLFLLVFVIEGQGLFIAGILADAFQFSEDDLHRRRAESVNNVKKTNGRISLEQRVREAWEEDNEWQD